MSYKSQWNFFSTCSLDQNLRVETLSVRVIRERMRGDGSLLDFLHVIFGYD